MQVAWVVSAARGEAARYQRNAIYGEHLLAALPGTRGSAMAVLAALGVTPEMLRDGVEHVMRSGGTPVGSRVDLSEEAHGLVEGAAREAEALGHPHVWTDHLLLAMAAEPERVAGSVLARLGVTADGLRPLVANLMVAYPGGRSELLEPRAEHVLGGRCLVLPAATRELDAAIGEARWQQTGAVDEEQYGQGAAWREERQRLEVLRERLLEDWGRIVGVSALAAEVHRLYRQADRLRELLGRGGVTVDLVDSWAEPGDWVRRPAPAGQCNGDEVTPSRAAPESPSSPQGASARPSELPPLDEPVLVENGPVSVRGWLEGPAVLVAQAEDYVMERVPDRSNFGWRFPSARQTYYGYAHFGLQLHLEDLDWFAAELTDLAALTDSETPGRLSGYFRATGPARRLQSWTLDGGSLESVVEHES